MKANTVKIIGICGKKESGKDTVGDYILSHYEGYTKLSFAGALKDICKILYPLLTDDHLTDHVLKEKIEVDTLQNQSPRMIMQRVGTDLFRKHYDENIWIRILNDSIRRHIQENQCYKFVITDVRFQNELDYILSTFEDAMMLNIQRETKSGVVDQHITENGLLSCESMITIENNGTLSELYQKVDHVLNITNKRQKNKKKTE